MTLTKSVTFWPVRAGLVFSVMVIRNLGAAVPGAPGSDLTGKISTHASSAAVTPPSALTRNFVQALFAANRQSATRVTVRCSAGSMLSNRSWMPPSGRYSYPRSASTGFNAGSQRATITTLVALTSPTFFTTARNVARSPTICDRGPVAVTSSAACRAVTQPLAVTGSAPSRSR